MKRTRQGRPTIEPLEGRMLLSNAAASPPHASAIVAGARAHLRLRLSLDGTIQGNWTKQSAIPDTGDTLTLQGSGTAQPLDPVAVGGMLQTPGFITKGHTTGTVTLSDDRGSVTLSVVGTLPQVGFSAPPSSFRYTVTDGTGGYAGVWGSGRATLQLRPSIHPSSPPGRLSPEYIIAPSFTLTLHRRTPLG
jgi:hypothetical protein